MNHSTESSKKTAEPDNTKAQMGSSRRRFLLHRSTIIFGFVATLLVIFLIVPGSFNNDFSSDLLGYQTHGWPFVYCVHKAEFDIRRYPDWVYPRAWSMFSTESNPNPREFFELNLLGVDILVGVSIVLLAVLIVEVRRRRRNHFFQISIFEIGFSTLLVAAAIAFNLNHLKARNVESRIVGGSHGFNDGMAFGTRHSSVHAEWSHDIPPAIEKLVGRKFSKQFIHLKYLECDFDELRNRDTSFSISELGELPALETLNPMRPTKEDLAEVSELTNIRELVVNRNDVDLTQFKHFEFLYLRNLTKSSQVDGLVNLKNLKGVSLEFKHGGKPEVVAKFLEKLPTQQIEKLELTSVKLTDEGFVQLKRFENLKTLEVNLEPCQRSWKFGELRQLESLLLSHSKINSDQVDSIIAMPKLNYLEWRNIDFRPSESQIAALKKKLGENLKHFTAFD